MGGKTGPAAEAHGAAAGAHDEAATLSRQNGDEAGAQKHEQIAMLHRRAGSVQQTAPKPMPGMQPPGQPPSPAPAAAPAAPASAPHPPMPPVGNADGDDDEDGTCPECGGQLDGDGDCEDCDYTENAMNLNQLAQQLIDNCGGPGGTKGPCRGSGSTRKAAAATRSTKGFGKKNAFKHRDAAWAHGDAAEEHQKLAASSKNEAVRMHHEGQAAKHEQAQKLHQMASDSMFAKPAPASTAITKPATTNQSEEEMTRSEILTRLVRNCGCQEDVAALNALTTETLTGIWNAKGGKGGKGTKAEGSNADVIGSGDFEQAGGEGEDSEDSNYENDEGDLDPDKVKVSSKEAFTGNSRKTPIQRRLTPDELEVWNEAQQMRDEKKKRIAFRLTANWSGDPVKRKRLMSQLLNNKTKEQLEEMAAFLPPSVNRRDFVQGEAVAPVYLGAAGGGVNNHLTDNADSDDILPLPVTNWSATGEEVREAN